MSPLPPRLALPDAGPANAITLRTGKGSRKGRRLFEHGISFNHIL